MISTPFCRAIGDTGLRFREETELLFEAWYFTIKVKKKAWGASMEGKAGCQKKKVSIFKLLWSWLLGRINRSDGMPAGNAGKEMAEQEATQKPSSLQPPEKQQENPNQGHLYNRLDACRDPLQTDGDAMELRVYTYCGVVFPKADIVYHYICTEENIQVGDRVLVPVWVHGEHKQAVGIVVSVGQYLDRCLPRPLQQTKYIIKKL